MYTLLNKCQSGLFVTCYLCNKEVLTFLHNDMICLLSNRPFMQQNVFNNVICSHIIIYIYLFTEILLFKSVYFIHTQIQYISNVYLVLV